MESISLPNSLVGMGNQVFYRCTGLQELNIPSTVWSIGFQAFKFDLKLADLTCLATTPPVIETQDVFNDENYANTILKVPAASVNAYANAEYWSLFLNIDGINAGLGDMNGDGIVSIIDVTSMINTLMNSGNFDLTIVDVNGDGQFTISDVSALISRLMSGN